MVEGNPQLIVGLTGGLASGKSTVASHFEALSVPVIDADVVARDVVAAGEPALEEIRQYFGPQVFKPTGELDRARLRQRIFADLRERQQLEQILHPRIRERILKALEQLAAPYAILMIPLLLESDQKYPVNRVLVVDTPQNQQLNRAAQRDGSDTETLKAIIAAQTSRDERLKRADDVIDNTGNIVELSAQVEQLHRKYLDLASNLPELARLQVTPDK